MLLLCFDWNLLTNIERVQVVHDNISDDIKKQNESLRSSIYDCLLNAMNNFNEFIINSNKHFDSCIEKKKFIGNCVDINDDLMVNNKSSSSTDNIIDIVKEIINIH